MTMDGRNCNGRKISLLNDESSLARTKIQLPSLVHSHSRASSSCESTPSLSPQTPPLVRSSSSSSDSRAFASPSPLTPSGHTFETQAPNAPPHHYYLALHAASKMDEQGAPMYPPLPDATGVMHPAYTMPVQLPPQIMQQQQQHPQTQPNQQVYRASTSPSSEPPHLAGASNAKAQSKKNQYPCPMAKQIGCTDFFTTSGHAARHAKKHTGKKDAFCPECNKAFTRKDNMEQHRRTHQHGRGAPRSETSKEANPKKVVKPQKGPAWKRSNVKAGQLETSVEQQLAEQAQQIPMSMPMSMPIQAQHVMQVTQAQQSIPQQVLDQQQQAMMMPPSGPYFLPTVDPGPIPSLPNAMPDLSMRPQLHRTNYSTSLDFVPMSTAPMGEVDPSHYSYPSPGLSNGLDSLALAASEHRRWSEEKAQSQSPQRTPSQDSP